MGKNFLPSNYRISITKCDNIDFIPTHTGARRVHERHSGAARQAVVRREGQERPLAAYELDELNEAFEDAAKYQPEFKGKPIAKIIEPMTAEPVAQLEKAIEAKDSIRFVRAYDSLTHACSACHQATDHGFISIQRPTFPPLTNQRFSLGRQP